MPGTGDPGRPVDVEADVVVATQPALAGVDAHADANAAFDWPGFRRQCPLRVRRSVHGPGRAREDDEERVALGRNFDPAGGLERLSEDRVMAIEHRPERRPKRVDELGRAFDVSEQEGQRPGRQLARGHIRRIRPTRERAVPFAGPS